MNNNTITTEISADGKLVTVTASPEAQEELRRELAEVGLVLTPIKTGPSAEALRKARGGVPVGHYDGEGAFPPNE